MSNKKTAYFQGGGGVNEPTPGEKKYKSDPAILVQPRFEEPFYRNYDYMDTEGIDGPAKYGPGSGWNHIMEYKSIKDFLEHRRKRLKGKYVADDFWIEDTSANYKQRADKMKVRASFFRRMVKTAKRDCENSDIVFSDGTDAFICGNCLHMGPNSGGETPSSKELHAGKNHNTRHIDWRNDANRENDPNYIKWKKDVSHDENDGANYDYGDGAYTAMSDGKKMKTITDAPHKSPGAFFTNAIDFDIDNQIKSGPIEGEEGSYPASVQIGGYLDKYLPENDFEDKPDSDLDVGRDYTEDAEMPSELSEEDLEHLSKKYLMPKENGLFGLPDGISPPDDLDPNATVNEPNPEMGETESGNTMYEDKWNI